MKFSTLATLVTVTVGAAAAQPHGHQHQHVHADKRAPSPLVVTVPGPTVIVYELNGSPISADDVDQGIANGTLVWADDGGITIATTSDAPTSTQTPVVLPPSTSSTFTSPSVAVARPVVVSSSSSSSSFSSSFSSSSSSSTTTSTSTKSSSTSAAAVVASSSSSSSSNSLGSATGVNAVFPDGQLSCSTFPSAYGALEVDWLGLGGWTGIQSPGSNIGGFSNIRTMTSNLCTGSNCCTEGSYCSYACPPGYQKSQWPSTQGATGQSVGGILCQNGKLHLTNPTMSTSLCMPGTSMVNVMVQNTMNTKATVCRTDYPGTEGETIPLEAAAGALHNLTCPDGSNYYTWQGLKTSAQYYVNPAGVGASDACQWGTASSPWGNWAPLNLGVGYSGGYAWLSIFQNSPTTSEKLDFTVEIVGNNGGHSNIIGKCKYSNGQYCSGDNYQTCSSTTGCTVSVAYGSATYVFS